MNLRLTPLGRLFRLDESARIGTPVVVGCKIIEAGEEQQTHECLLPLGSQFGEECSQICLWIILLETVSTTLSNLGDLVIFHLV